MKSLAGLASFLLTASALTFAAGTAQAQALQVAADPPAPVAATPAPVAATPAPAVVAPVAGPSSTRDAARIETPEEPRDKTVLGGSAYVTTGVVLDELRDAGFVARVALDLYASIGLGDVSLLIGGTVLGAEFTVFGDRKGVGIPMLFTLGLRDDTWMVALDSGATLGFDNSYNERDDAEESLPSPRTQVRAGYRLHNSLEVSGVVGYERQLYANREGVNRLLVGVTVGVGGDG